KQCFHRFAGRLQRSTITASQSFPPSSEAAHSTDRFHPVKRPCDACTRETFVNPHRLLQAPV
ncbi:MAG TPA: hypothetical protein PK403_16695, partial [Plasticicumulans sp.]|nr:hypothetical protein [Plasticicumulans sp.]